MSIRIAVKRGTFQYEGTVRCNITIWMTNMRSGSGDEADPEDIREDEEGTFYLIQYSHPNFGGGSEDGYYESVEEATRRVESKVKDVRWE